MNLIGKILVVVIAVMSIMFMGVAISLFTTHNNWKSTIDAQKETITTLNADLEKLDGQYKLDDSNLTLEIEAAEQQIRKLESEHVALGARNDATQGAISELKQVRRDTTTAIASTQANNKRLAEENATLARDTATTQLATNAAFTKAVEATSELHDAKVKLETELERNAQLLEQVEGNR